MTGSPLGPRNNGCRPPDIIGRDEAKALGLKRFFTGKPCKRGHIAERYVRSGICSKCARKNFRRWYAENREHVQERVRKYQKDHPQKVQETRQDRLTKRQAAQRRAELVRLRLANARLTESAKSRPDWQTRRHAPAAVEKRSNYPGRWVWITQPAGRRSGVLVLR
jgi:hypothetical protein